MSEVVRQKEELREHCREYRVSITTAVYRSLSRAIITNVFELPEVVAARTVHVYWPMVHRREIDTRGLIAHLRRDRKRIVLPVVTGFERKPTSEPRMQHVLWLPDEPLRPNRWGIGEPGGGPTVPLNEIDVVMVPVLGAGRNGYRVGHGYGYYDEFLATLDAARIGLVYSECLVDHVPAENHDVPLDVIVTESDIIRMSRRNMQSHRP